MLGKMTERTHRAPVSTPSGDGWRTSCSEASLLNPEAVPNAEGRRDRRKEQDAPGWRRADFINKGTYTRDERTPHQCTRSSKFMQRP